MALTPRLKLRYPILTDTADVPRDIGNLAADLDNAAIDGQGLLANRPVSTSGVPGIQGRYYYATDTGVLYRDHGTGWVQVSTPAFTLLPDSVTDVELAPLAVGTPELKDSAVTSAKIADGTVAFADLAAALKPSQGASSSAEALRAIGTGAGEVAAGQHASTHRGTGGDPLAPLVDTLPGSPVDEQECRLEVVAGTRWHLIYDSALGSYRWTFNGGPALHGERDSDQTNSGSGAWYDENCQVAIPYAGIFDVAFGGDSEGRISWGIVGPGVTHAELMREIDDGGTDSRIKRLTFTSAGNIQVFRYLPSTPIGGGGFATFTSRNVWISVSPVRVG
jgi:hypothetical protein